LQIYLSEDIDNLDIWSILDVFESSVFHGIRCQCG
jgi:hypothetical protein